MTEPKASKLAERWLGCLQANGYRLTPSRRAVVETIASSQQALSPLEVFEQARRRYPKLGLVTVYRTVEKLEGLSLIQRVHQPAGCHAFISNSSGHQHILICQECGRVEFFSGEKDQIDLLMTEVGQKSGFRVEDHWLQLFGICNNCQ